MQNQALDTIISIVCSVFDAYSAVLFLPGGNEEEYRIAARFSLGDEIDEETVIAPGKGLVGWIIRNGKPLLINDFDRKRNRLGYYRSKEEDSIKAFMGCPVRGGSGALCLDSKRTYSFSEKDQKILDLFSMLIARVREDAGLAAEGLAEHELYESLKELHGLRARHPRWGEYRQRFLDLVSGTIGFEYAFLAARDDQGKHFFLEGSNRPLPGELEEAGGKTSIKSGLVGWVFNNEKPVYIDEENPAPAGAPLFGKEAKNLHFSSIVCLPLRIHKRVRGVLVLADPSLKRIDAETRTYLGIAADDLALLLENLYLKNRLTTPATKS